MVRSSIFRIITDTSNNNYIYRLIIIIFVIFNELYLKMIVFIILYKRVIIPGKEL